MTRGEILDQAKKTICNDRQDVYGDPENSFPVIAKFWETYLSEITHSEIKLTPRNAAEMLVLFKLARIATGKFKEDNYIDLCGYSAIASSLEQENVIAECKVQEFNVEDKNKRKYLNEDPITELIYTRSEELEESENDITFKERSPLEYVSSMANLMIILSHYSGNSSKIFVKANEQDLEELIDKCLDLETKYRTNDLNDKISYLKDKIEQSELNPQCLDKFNKYLNQVGLLESNIEEDYDKSVVEESSILVEKSRNCKTTKIFVGAYRNDLQKLIDDCMNLKEEYHTPLLIINIRILLSIIEESKLDISLSNKYRKYIENRINIKKKTVCKKCKYKKFCRGIHRCILTDEFN